VQISLHRLLSNSQHRPNNFQANGIDPDTVDWIIAPSDSYWTRDYGPWFVFDGNGDIRIIDHYYNRPARPNDNVIPIACGAQWGIPVHTHDLWTTGGNYMTDGEGISFSTDLVWTENPGMTHDQIFQRMQDYYGLNTYNVVPDISTSGITIGPGEAPRRGDSHHKAGRIDPRRLPGAGAERDPDRIPPELDGPQLYCRPCLLPEHRW
jgi:hypothetical protein